MTTAKQFIIIKHNFFFFFVLENKKLFLKPVAKQALWVVLVSAQSFEHTSSAAEQQE